MEQVHLEIPLSSKSRPMIWDAIGNVAGLEAWMADRIMYKDDVYTFCWGNDEQREAVQTGKRIGTYVRFHWLDEGPKTYFELRVNYSELTHSFALEITEVTDDDDVEGLTQLWESYAEKLIKVTGL